MKQNENNEFSKPARAQQNHRQTCNYERTLKHINWDLKRVKKIKFNTWRLWNTTQVLPEAKNKCKTSKVQKTK